MTTRVLFCLRPFVLDPGGEAYSWTVYHRDFPDLRAPVGQLRRGHPHEGGAWVVIGNNFMVHAGDTPDQALAAFEFERPRIRIYPPGRHPILS